MFSDCSIISYHVYTEMPWCKRFLLRKRLVTCSIRSLCQERSKGHVLLRPGKVKLTAQRILVQTQVKKYSRSKHGVCWRIQRLLKHSEFRLLQLDWIPRRLKCNLLVHTHRNTFSRRNFIIKPIKTNNIYFLLYSFYKTMY